MKKFFTQVGCGSNAFWLETFVLTEFVITGFIILSYAMNLASLAYFHSSTVQTSSLAYEVIIAILLCIHCYYLTLPIKAERSARNIVEYNLWLSWSNYLKGLAIGSVMGVAAVTIAAFILPDEYWNQGGRQAVMYLCWLFTSRGLLLLLTKNRYQEKIALEKLANIGRESEKIQQVYQTTTENLKVGLLTINSV